MLEARILWQGPDFVVPMYEGCGSQVWRHICYVPITLTATLMFSSLYRIYMLYTKDHHDTDDSDA